MNETNRISEFKYRLREALDKRNMKAVELSKKTNVPEGAISYYLSGKSQPKGDRLHTICVALNVSEAWMLGYDISMERTPDQIRNDHLAKIIFKMRSDEDFFDVVCLLAELPDDQYAAVKVLLSNLVK